MLPKGADCVLMIEDTQVICEKMVEVFERNHRQQHLLPATVRTGAQKGTLVLPKGTLLGPEHIAVLASMGCHTPQVSRKPSCIISTGDELVEPSETSFRFAECNSNSWQLLAQAQQMNAEGNYAGIAKDTEDDTRKKNKGSP